MLQNHHAVPKYDKAETQSAGRVHSIESTRSAPIRGVDF